MAAANPVKFRVAAGAWPFVGAALTPATEPFRFSPPRRCRVRPCLPAWRRCGICSWRSAAGAVAAAGASSPFSDEQACGIQAALRAGAAELAHQEGHLSFERHQGVWLLQLAGSHALICHGLSVVNRALAVLSPAVLNEAAKPAPYAAERAKRYRHSPSVSPIAGGAQRANRSGAMACHLDRRRWRVKTAAVAPAVRFPLFRGR